MYLLPSDWEVVGAYNTAPITPHAPGRMAVGMDFTRKDAYAFLDQMPPVDAVIHCAALTNVDRCEVYRQSAYALHVGVTQQIAEYCRRTKTHLIHISTDHIFDGNSGAYREDSPPHPLNYYAQTKLEAEAAVLQSGAAHTIVRTNFFGYNFQSKNDLASWIVSTLQEQEPVRLFTDAIFSPLLVNTFSEWLEYIISQRLQGLYNVAGHDSISKYAFGVRLAELFSLDKSLIEPVSIADSHLTARRPKNMSLDVSLVERIVGHRLPTAEESLRAYHALSTEGYPQKLKNFLTSSV